jgi:hypothetical protein
LSHFVALSAGATVPVPRPEIALPRSLPEFKWHAGAKFICGQNFSYEKYGQNRTRIDAILKKFEKKMTFIITINLILKYIELQIYPMNPPAALPNLVRLSVSTSR